MPLRVGANWCANRPWRPGYSSTDRIRSKSQPVARDAPDRRGQPGGAADPVLDPGRAGRASLRLIGAAWAASPEAALGLPVASSPRRRWMCPRAARDPQGSTLAAPIAISSADFAQMKQTSAPPAPTTPRVATPGAGTIA